MPHGRGSAGHWGRLKPVEVDPLESMGLPSKGETRLLDFKVQNQYYTEIVKRYLTFCSDAGDRDSLLAQFASLSIDAGSSSAASSSSSNSNSNSSSTATGATGAGGGGGVVPSTTSKASAKQQQLPPPSKSALAAAAAAPGPSHDLSAVLMALRKLREGIVASQRADDFAAQAYLFCVRLAVLVKQPESYHPAILHLLRRIHPRRPLTSVELQEVSGYLVLDAACRRGDLSEAHVARLRYGLRDVRVDAVLRALAQDNYAAFARLRAAVDGHKARLMEFAEPLMRRQALLCFGRTYLSVDLAFLVRSTGRSWEELRGKDGVGWERDGQRVVVRKIKART